MNEMKNDEATKNSNEQEKNDNEKLEQEQEPKILNEESPEKDEITDNEGDNESDSVTIDSLKKELSENKENSIEEGLNLIQKEILSILEKFNVKKIKALGEDFDANFHQAMFEKETNEFEAGKVCEIVQDGYSFHDRLLRPVLVGVAKKPKENNNDKKIEDDKVKENEEKS